MKEDKKNISNCYRALLAQVNYLDGISNKKQDVKDLYEELSILAFYIMEDDYESIMRTINEIKELSRKIEESSSQGKEKTSAFNLILQEIKTHLDYLLLQYA
ncbi:hypothetical protein [Thermosyntropha sp.]|uniref:hypothetical protein n=1 Tax=Thermosyntropha sp. TaxID=2740820 RepID=UPI0025F22A16|nr:hypothetical protein [Thermosyntropha sp.]MBO8158105.1 hypothetical protein [Thermosyntropha sp.]